eukprot:GHVP01011439.1.p1 GENE.GHVP01011439.1~~GHVP01011439.1.p1  ORF type:complete len:273 (+),score=47.44 GHVP01011439.1:101-919(+)
MEQLAREVELFGKEIDCVSSPTANHESTFSQLCEKVYALPGSNPLSCETPGTEEMKLLILFHEVAAYFYLKAAKLQPFEREMAELTHLYFGLGSQESSRAGELLGLFLFYLLSEDRVGDLHIQLQKFPIQFLQKELPCIKFVLQTERDLLQGRYDAVLDSCQRNLPIEQFGIFSPRMVNMMRSKIASTVEVSYQFLPAVRLAQMLRIDSEQKLEEFINEKNGSISENSEESAIYWKAEGNRVYFSRGSPRSLSHWDFLSNIIHYAMEVERIV